MKRIINLLMIGCVFAAAINAQMPGTAYSLYMEERNETMFAVERLEIPRADDLTVLLGAVHSITGTKLKARPRTLTFIVQVGISDLYKFPEKPLAFKDWYRFQQTVRMKVKIDGKSAPDVILSNHDRRMKLKPYMETLAGSMRYSTFKAISRARSVELRLEKTSITIDSASLAPFADLDKMLNPT